MTTAAVRAFNDEGISRLSEFLSDVRGSASPVPMPYHWLTDAGLTDAVEGTAQVTRQTFTTRLDLARYLCDVLEPLDDNEYENSRMWSWLSLFYFDTLAPESSRGGRIVGANYRHIASGAWRTYYRHLLAGPHRLYRAHGETARIFLTNAPHRPGEVNESFASRQEIVGRYGIVEAIDLLYYSEERQTYKRGCTTPDSPGSLRRLVAVLKQFELTYDLSALCGKEIVALLPDEFSRFLEMD